jgi:predicted secreted protein
MATITGNDGAISVNGIAVLAVRSWSIDMTADTIETTTMGNDTRTYIKGLSTFSGSADVYFDPDTATSGFDAAETTFNPANASTVVGASGVAGKFYVEYLASGNDQLFQGNLIVTGYTVNSSMDGMVEASISFQGTGSVAFSTGSSVSYP